MTGRWIPNGDRVVIRFDKAPTEQGGIILPAGSVEAPMSGEVLAVGDAVDVGVIDEGDAVYCSKYAGVELELSCFSSDGRPEKVKVMKVAEVLLIRPQEFADPPLEMEVTIVEPIEEDEITQ